jgi:hypothetical protein
MLDDLIRDPDFRGIFPYARYFDVIHGHFAMICVVLVKFNRSILQIVSKRIHGDLVDPVEIQIILQQLFFHGFDGLYDTLILKDVEEQNVFLNRRVFQREQHIDAVQSESIIGIDEFGEFPVHNHVVFFIKKKNIIHLYLIRS